MSDEKIEVPPLLPELPAEALPKCMACDADPVNPSCRECNIGPFKFLIVFCGACRATIGTALLAVAQPQIQRPGPRIIRPQ